MSAGPFGEALNSLNAAQSPADFARAGELLAGELGFERFAFLVLRGGEAAEVSAVVHNAPEATRNDADLLDLLAGDAVVARARQQRIPFTWGPGGFPGGEFVSRYADSGYRCGVSGSAWNRRVTGCIVLVSTSAATIEPEAEVTAWASVALAATTFLAALQRLQPAAPCPLSQRELSCLLHALAGLSGSRTAEALGISTRSVVRALERSRSVLRARTSYAAATLAVRRGWLDMEHAMALADSARAASPGAGNAKDDEQSFDEKRHG